MRMSDKLLFAVGFYGVERICLTYVLLQKVHLTFGDNYAKMGSSAAYTKPS